MSDTHTPSSQPPDGVSRPIRVERSSKAPGYTQCLATFDPQDCEELSAEMAVFSAAVLPVAGDPVRTTGGGGSQDYHMMCQVTTVYLLKIWQDKNNYCRVLPKQIEIKLQISHQNAKVPNN